MPFNPLYRRPARAKSSTSTLPACSKRDASLRSGSLSNVSISGVPAALSFDMVMKDATCPPMTSRDFMKYLLYVEHGAENLQFFLWYRNYVERFNELPQTEKSLSPPYVPPPDNEISRPSTAKLKSDGLSKELFDAPPLPSHNLHHLVPMASMQSMKSDPFSDPPSNPSISPFDIPMGDAVIDHKKVTADAFAAAAVPQPFTIQPFRNEMSRVIAVYLAESSPRELNLSSSDRAKAIKAVAQTTHPSALEHVNRHVEELLRLQSHPNFVRWSLCNGNRPRVIFARGLGVAMMVGGFTIAILLTLGSGKRGYRALAAIPWALGIATLWAGLKGMCVVLHGWHHRHLRPWELWVDEDEKSHGSKLSFDLDDRPNSYEDEPWVKKYEKRFLVRKIFDREVWIEEPALRQIQDAVALQGIGIALACSIVFTVIFVVLPHGNFF
ncbi:hypothetical protein EX30DRAFT_370557 [Ascodesmis nigricans]|uniref:RGS domain-containing protein n=1 Tax=Ascodesmis nigricans TaxID=341454 RepID=A0A4S2N0M9_9PEZI|nr:hypothetical protein EX30DRAFT_370557 [Ascodesmis nigricans]